MLAGGLLAGLACAPNWFAVPSEGAAHARTAGDYVMVGEWPVIGPGTDLGPGTALCPVGLPIVRQVGDFVYDGAGRLLVDVTCAPAAGTQTDRRLTVLEPQTGGAQRLDLQVPAGSPLAYDPLQERLYCTDRNEVQALALPGSDAEARRWAHRAADADNVPLDIAIGPDGTAFTFSAAGVGRYGPDSQRYAPWQPAATTGGPARPGSLAVDSQARVTVHDAGAGAPLRRYAWNGAPDGQWRALEACPSAGPLASYPGADTTHLLCGDGVGGNLFVRVLAPDGSTVADHPVGEFLAASPRPSLAAAPDGGFALKGRTMDGFESLRAFGPDGAQLADVRWGSAGAPTATSAHLSTSRSGLALVTDRGSASTYEADGASRHAWWLPQDTLDSALGQDGAVYLLRGSAQADAVLGRYSESGEPAWSTRTGADAGPGLAVGDRFAYGAVRLGGYLAVFDVADGTPVGRLQLSDSDDVILPCDVAGGSGDEVLVLDCDRKAVQVWDPSTSLLRPKRTLALGELADPIWPVALAAATDGRLAVVEKDITTKTPAQRLRVLGPDGAALWSTAPGSDGIDAQAWLHDVAFDRQGRLLVLVSPAGTVSPMGGGARVLVFAGEPSVATPTPAGSTPTPPPPPPANAGPCTVRGDKWADPTEIWLGEEVTVTLTLGQDCPRPTGPADVVLVVDVSGSMQGEKAKAVGRSVAAFAAMLDLTRHRLGVVTFNGAATLHLHLTNSASAIAGLPDQFGASGGTSMKAGLQAATDHLRAAGRPGVKQVIVFFTDGQSADDPVPLAVEARAEGMQIYAVGTADADMAVLIRMAGSVQRAFHAPSASDLPALYELIASVVGSDAGGVMLEDVLGRDVTLVAGSLSEPPYWGAGGGLRWAWQAFVVAPMTITYRVEPRRTGWVPTNETAWFDYVDADQTVRRFTYGVPRVLVRDRDTATPTPSRTPTATPTATATHTPTATPRPGRLYLPIAVREPICHPEKQRIDAALVIDTSSSMEERTTRGRRKLDAALEAAALFVDELALGAGDQAAVVFFNRDAHVAQPLTADRQALRRALAGAVVATQTCLPCGVEAAFDQLDGSRHRPANRPVMIVLTDGLSNPRPASEAVAAARAAREAGITVYTVGLGPLVDFDALGLMASSSDCFHRTEDAEQLAAIYAQIAVDIPCPTDIYWGQRR